MEELTIVMYHYVRKLDKSRYPSIKGLDVQDFIRQLNYLEEHYTFVRMEDCLEKLQYPEKDFPSDAVLLTFDDGYIDHYTEVFPLLDERGIQGSFFPPVESTMEDKVLDVNKIHFVLASLSSSNDLLKILGEEILTYKNVFNLSNPEEYYNRVGKAEHPYDSREVMIFKIVLQRELPLKVRQLILSKLFKKYIDTTEEAFSNELYMNEDQLKCMIRSGMFVGGHGYSHLWLNSISREEQAIEVKSTKQFLSSLGVDMDKLVMCYPYGAYDKSLIQILKNNGYQLGLTTQPKTAELSKMNRFTLGRFDTNEIG